jgi:hypothetical protein
VPLSTVVHRPPVRAVLIGVQDVPQANSPPAAGAQNDAVAWSAIASAVGYSLDEQVDVLTSPVLVEAETADYLPPSERRGLATRAAMVTAIQDMIQALRDEPGGRALLVYSGHGTLIGSELHLCPSDTAWQDGALINTIGLGELLEWIEGSAPSPEDVALPGLTLVLDCCFAGADGVVSSNGAPGGPARTLSAPAAPNPASDAALAAAGQAYTTLSTRIAASGIVILAASAADESAYAYSLRPNPGRHAAVHGVFTAALSATLQRWSPWDPTQTSATWPIPITLGTLVQRARLFAAALEFEQTPTLTGPAHEHAFYGDFGDTVRRAPAIPGKEISAGNNGFWMGKVVNAGLTIGVVIGVPDGNGGGPLTAFLTTLLPPTATLAPADASIFTIGNFPQSVSMNAATYNNTNTTWGTYFWGRSASVYSQALQSAAKMGYLYDLTRPDQNNQWVGFLLSRGTNLAYCWHFGISWGSYSFTIAASTFTNILIPHANNDNNPPAYIVQPFSSAAFAASKTAQPASPDYLIVDSATPAAKGSVTYVSGGPLNWFNEANTSPFLVPVTLTRSISDPVPALPPAHLAIDPKL